MKRTRTLSAAAVALAMVGAMTLPAQALGQYGSDSQVTGSAELRGTVKSLTLPTLVIAVQSVSGEHLSSTLRLFKGHDLVLTTDSSTVVRRDNKTAPLASVRVTDTVNVRTKCTFTTTNNVTTTSCLAQRIYAYTAQPPRPVTVVITGTVSTKAAASFTMSVSKIDADSRARAVADALRATQPLAIAVDSKTVVRFGDTTLSFAYVSVGSATRVQASCTVVLPYNCTATRIDIVGPRAEKVILVGKVTAVSTNSLALTVMSVVHQEDDALDVQVLHDQTLNVVVAKGVAIRKGGHSSALTAIAVGSQVTIRAHCQLLAPFICAADRVTIKA